jgi:hypothetical protein
MKILKFFVWVSAVIGSSFLILGLIQMIYGFALFLSGTDRIGGGRLFGDTEIINFFIAASTFFIITTISLLIQIKELIKKG